MGTLGSSGRPEGVEPTAHGVSLRVVLVGLVALAVGLVAVTFAAASHVEPVPGPDNPQASDCPAGTTGWKYEPVTGGSGLGDGTLVVDITVNDTDLGPTFDFSANLPVVTVFVKGGPVGNAYNYDPPVTADSGLHAPVNPSNDKYYGLSHLVFCYSAKGTIVVEKQTEPDGDSQSFAFTSDFAGDFSLSDGQQRSSGLIAPGTYAVSETVLQGWDLTSATCDDGSSPSSIGLSAGETVTCTFVNTKRGRIVVEKEANPSDTGETFDFTASWGAFALAHGQQADSGLLEPGTYSVSESVPAGWKLASATCDDGSSPGSIGLDAGETVTCTFVNVQPGRIVVEKQTDPSGSQQSFEFTATYGSFSLSDGQQSDSGELDPGTYSVSENVPSGWSLTSATCDDGSSPASIGLDAGETVTCTFLNTQQGQVIVEKVMEGGTGSFDFSGTPNGTISVNGGTLAATVDPGSYTSTESVATGWDLVSIECDDSDSSGDIGTRTASFEVDPGETVTCTFTNEVEDGTIVVEKRTNPAGDPTLFSFTFGEDGFQLGDGQQELFDGLEPGTYGVSEDVPDGWDLTSAICDDGSDPAEIDLAAGENVTCVFTNTKRGTIVVEKETTPAGAPDSFSFSGDASGSIGDGGQIAVTDLEPGTYTSTEGAVETWLLTAIVCDDENSTGDLGTRTATFALDPGETVTCTFRNSRITLGQGSIDVQKSADPTSLKEPGGPVTFSVRITNTSNVNVAITNVVDDRFGDLDDDGGSGCFDVPINLAPGEGTGCQFVGNVTGPAGTVHVNTVTASGVDQFGNAVADSDDARVVITPRQIDLVIEKTATSPTPLNGIVNYTLTVTNRGPDTATNVQVADPAPAGITYLTATPSQGTCALTPSLVTCSLGTIAPGQVVTIAITARATAVGTHVNTATVTGSGGVETNPADNVDSAQTVVPAPLQPPTSQPRPPVQDADYCLALTVTPKMVTADGKPDRIRAVVRGATKPLKGKKVLVRGAGVRKGSRTNSNGVAVITINPRRVGLITITTVDKRESCGAKRIGVVGVFLPPVTG